MINNSTTSVAARDKANISQTNLSLSDLQQPEVYYQTVIKQQTSKTRGFSSKKQQMLVPDDLNRWANSFRVRRDSANNNMEAENNRKTMQGFSNKPRSSLEIDPEQQ